MTQTPRFAFAAASAPVQATAAAGRDVLALGGNALEACVAMAAHLAVRRPDQAGLGADATFLVREPGGRLHVIDAVGVSGANAAGDAHRKAGYDILPRRGVIAALSVPGAVAGWILALDMARAFGGKIPLAELLSPAIKSAREGAAHSLATPADLPDLAQAPGFAETFLEDGKWPQAGAQWSATKRADVLEQLAHAGLRDFYRGDIGHEIAGDLERLRALLTRLDFEKYEARVRTPLGWRQGLKTFFAASAPTCGVTHLIAHALQSRMEVSWRQEDALLHGLLEASKAAWRMGASFAIDPALLDRKPESALTARALEEQATLIGKDRAKALSCTPDAPQALSISAADDKGYVVIGTISMGDAFGAGCVLHRTGLLLNNAGRFFSLDPRAPHTLAPKRKVPFASSPIMAVHDEGRVLALGSGCVDMDAQILARISAGQGLAEALEAPRLRIGFETRVSYEDRFDPSTLRGLEKRGHALTSATQYFGAACALARHRDGSIEAAHDPRTEGGAEGF